MSVKAISHKILLFYTPEEVYIWAMHDSLGHEFHLKHRITLFWMEHEGGLHGGNV